MKKQSYIQSIIGLIPFFLILSTVFIINTELGNEVVSGKYFWFYFSMGLLAVISILTQRKVTQPAQICIPDILIIAFFMITLFFSYIVNHSEAITKHILLLLIVLWYFYCKVFFRSYRSGIYWVVLFVMCTGMIEAYWGLKQLYGFTHSQHSLFKLTGSFFNPGPYACYLSVILPIAFYYVIYDWSCSSVKFNIRYWQIYLRWTIALVTCTGILVILPAAMSRASWLAVIGSCGFIILFYAIQNKNIRIIYCNHKRYCQAGLVLLSIILFVGCIGMYYLKKDSADGRALIWKNAIQVMIYHPTGVGIGHFSGSYGKEQAAYFATGKGTVQEEYIAGNPDYAFNEYLQIGVEQGIIPFLLFIGIILYSVYAGIKRKKVAPTASLVALLIVCAMSYPFSILPFLIIVSFLLAWIHAGGKGYRISGKQTILFYSCSLVLVAGSLYNRLPTYQAYKKWKNLSVLYNINLYEGTVEKYAELFPLLADQLIFLFEYAQCLSKTDQYEESNRVLEKAIRISCDPMLYNIMGKNYQALQQYNEAESCFLMAAYIVPHRIYPYFLLTNMYLETGDMEKAQKYGTIVLTKDPKVESTAIREMRESVKKGLTD